MTINPNSDLFKAILALDSYNRGYNAGLDLRPRDASGNLILEGGNPIASDKVGTEIGGVTVYASNGTTEAQNASFYAIAYEYGEQVIISYRGTDQFLPDAKAFLIGGGFFQATQARLAIEFFQAIDTDPAKTVSLTGHSLGGGLAGLVSSLFQTEPSSGKTPNAVIFDNMPFELAAKNIYDNSKPYNLNGNNYPNGFLPALKQMVYGDKTPWAPATYTAANSGIRGYSMQGEVLEELRDEKSGVLLPLSVILPKQQTSVQKLNLAGELGLPQIDGISSGLTGGGLHSMGALVIRMFAETEVASNDWQKASKYFWPKLFNNDFATSIGIGNIQGADNNETKLRSILAYSAINEGTRIFGDTGIRAFYNDANDLGNALGWSTTPETSPLAIYASQLSAVFVEYAAKLAGKKITLDSEYGQTHQPLDGVLSVDEDGKALNVDFDALKWQGVRLGSETGNAVIKGRGELIDMLKIEAVDKLQILGNLEKVDNVSLAATNENTSYSLPDSTTGKINIYMGATGKEEITGSIGDDYLYGGAGDDTLWGGLGNDVLHGGSGNNTLYGGAGRDTYHFVGTTRIIDNEGQNIDILLHSSSLVKAQTNYYSYGVDMSKATATLTGLSAKNIGANLLEISLIDYKTEAIYINTGSLLQYHYRIAEQSTISTVTLDPREIEYLRMGGDTFRIADIYNWLKDNGGEINVVPNWRSGGGNSIDLSDYLFQFSSSMSRYAKPLTPAEILGSAAGLTPETDSNGTITGLVLDNPGLGGSVIQLTAGYQTWHPFVIQSVNTVGNETTIDYSAAVQSITLASGITMGDVRLGASGTLGNADLVVHIDSLGYSFTIAGFEQGLTLTGIGLYDNALHESIQDADSAQTNSGANGQFTGVYEGGNLAIDSQSVNQTYHAERIVFSNGSFIDLTGTFSITGTTGADTLHGFDTRDDYIDGGAGNDKLYGYGGNDTLFGGLGTDTLYGGLGDDVYIRDDADVIVENADEGIDTVLSSLTYTLAANVENLILTGTTAINGTGNALDNTLVGNSAINTLAGGAGNDVYYVSTGDVVSEGSGNGIDTIYADVNWTLASNVENLVLIGAAITGTGNTLANTLTGNDLDNTLNGGTGADTLIGGLGNDYYIIDNVGDVVLENADEGIDTIQTALNNYTLAENVENLILTTSSNLNANGNDLDNTLTGNSGRNTLTGGLGNDYYIVQNSTDVVVENADEGIDTIQSTIAYTLPDHVENLILSGTSNIAGTGNALDNTLTGNSGVNTLSGGTGNDVYYVGTGDVIVEALDAGIDTVYAGVNWTLHSNVENLILTGAALTGTGNALDNILTGTDGNNTLNGMVGADTMIGGLGDDLYIVDNAGDVVVEHGDEGIDTVQSSITYTLSENVENLVLTGALAIDGYGNELDNTLTGNSAANTLYGGLGDDVYVVQTVTDVVVENDGEGIDTVLSSVTYTLSDHVENITLTGSSGIHATGNDLNNIITGNSGANTLIGGAGDDTFDGGAGVDRIYGGEGNDTLYGGSSTDTLVGGTGDDVYILDGVDVIIENADEGIDTVYSSVTYTLAANLEILSLTGATAINGTGNALDNTLIGNSAVNTLSGGAGDDVYYVSTGDVVSESSGNGIDTVYADVNWTLHTNVENLFLTGAALAGTGNALANILTGTGGNNTLNGLAGADTMVGGLGDDLYVVDNVGDLVVENDNEGIDTVQTALNGYTLAAHVENLLLTGSSNIDGNGNDLDNTLTGNSGRNTLTGGLGNDYYIIQNSTDVVVENADEGIDTIQSTITYTLSDHVENLVLAGATAINGTGNALDNTLTGNSARNTLSGGLGNDVYIVQTSTDVVIENVDEGIDTVLAELDWTLHSNVENLILTGAAVSGTGNTLDNILIGNEHNNTLNGMAGADTMFGGLGDDVYIIDNADDLVYENESSGTDTIQASVSYALPDHVENITLTGAANIDATGNELDNTLTGSSGLNTLYGGLGNDVYVVNNTDDVVVEYEDEGIDTVLASVTYTLSDHVENITLTGTSGIHATGNDRNNIIIGNSGANTLIGGAGDDTFDGGAGVDRIYGGEGNDTLYGGSSTDTLAGGDGDDVYILDGVDVIIENADEGIDTVYSSVTYTLAANLEILVLTGETAINGTGNALDNIFIGNSAINTLSGGAGNDVYYVSTGDVVSESSGNGVDTVYADVSWTLHNNVENLFLMAEAVSGTGNAVDNILTGNDLDNTLNGLAGADTLIGGLGDDVYIVDNIGDVVVEYEDEGIDTIQSSVSYTLGDHIENLNLTGSSALNATGNALDNIIVGNTGANILIGGEGNDILDGGSGNDTLDGGAGNDFLNGGAGSDTMIGGAGDDIYVVNAAGDVVIENADEGIDTVYSGVTYTLGDHLEHLTLTGTSNIHGTGNAHDNTLIGNTGANTLSGGDGNDYIYGDAGNDVIFGGFGDDIIFGGAGTDNLYGEAGADIFGFEAATAYSGVDVIRDFSVVDGDRIDISDVLDGLYSGNMDNLLSFVQVSQSGSNTHISIDRDGAGSLYGWTQIANIEGVTGLGNANDMLAAGVLVVANS